MYVCLCKSVTDTEIRGAAKRGARRLEDLQRELGVATGCGRCAECACSVMAEAHAEARHENGRLIPEVPAVFGELQPEFG